MKSAAFAFASVTTSAAAAVEARRMDNAMALRRAERENVMTSPPCEEFDLFPPRRSIQAAVDAPNVGMENCISGRREGGCLSIAGRGPVGLEVTVIIDVLLREIPVGRVGPEEEVPVLVDLEHVGVG